LREKIMEDLSLERLMVDSHPFTIVGVEYLGPIKVFHLGIAY